MTGELPDSVIASELRSMRETMERNQLEAATSAREILTKLDSYLPRETFNTWERGHDDRVTRIENAALSFTTDTMKREGDIRTELKGDVTKLASTLEQNAQAMRRIWLTVGLGFLSTLAAGIVLWQVTSAA